MVLVIARQRQKMALRTPIAILLSIVPEILQQIDVRAFGIVCCRQIRANTIGLKPYDVRY